MTTKEETIEKIGQNNWEIFEDAAKKAFSNAGEELLGFDNLSTSEFLGTTEYPLTSGNAWVVIVGQDSKNRPVCEVLYYAHIFKTGNS